MNKGGGMGGRRESDASMASVSTVMAEAVALAVALHDGDITATARCGADGVVLRVQDNTTGDIFEETLTADKIKESCPPHTPVALTQPSIFAQLVPVALAADAADEAIEFEGMDVSCTSGSIDADGDRTAAYGINIAATYGSGIMQMRIDIPIEVPLTVAASPERKRTMELQAVVDKGERKVQEVRAEMREELEEMRQEQQSALAEIQQQALLDKTEAQATLAADRAELKAEQDAKLSEMDAQMLCVADIKRQMPLLLAIAAQSCVVTARATIPLNNLEPKEGLEQALKFKDDRLQPGKYQVDSPVRLAGEVHIDGEVELIGGGRFHGTQFDINDKGVLKASGVAFSDSASPLVTVNGGGAFEGEGCTFERCTNGNGALYVPANGRATVKDTTFRGSNKGVYVQGASARATFSGCGFFDHSEGAVQATTAGCSVTIDGGEVRGNHGDQAALYANGAGQISVTNVQFSDNAPTNAAADANPASKISGA